MTIAKVGRVSRLERFETFVMREPNSGCWLWTGAVCNDKGFYRPKFQIDGRSVGAHRVAWTLFCGPIPADVHVLHKCDTPCCVNPKHLFLGTHQDNVRDMDQKERRCIASKLNEADVIEIRRLLTDGFGVRAVARIFGMDKSTISRIKSKQNWVRPIGHVQRVAVKYEY